MPRRGRADGSFRRIRLGDLLHQPVRWNHHMRAVADAQLIRYIDPGGDQLLDFFVQRQRIDHQPVADYRGLAGMQDAARNQPEHEFTIADEDGVARVMAALIADDVVETVGQQIDQFALAFVAPLRAQNNNIAHSSL